MTKQEKLPYTFRARYCGTPNCGKLFSLRYDVDSGYYIDAATYLPDNNRVQRVTDTCPKCGAPIDDTWLATCLDKQPMVTPGFTTFADASSPRDD